MMPLGPWVSSALLGDQVCHHQGTKVAAIGFSSWLFSPPAENPTQLRESRGAGNPWTCLQGQIQNHSSQYVPLCPFASPLAVFACA